MSRSIRSPRDKPLCASGYGLIARCPPTTTRLGYINFNASAAAAGSPVILTSRPVPSTSLNLKVTFADDLGAVTTLLS